jgi:hypothetical protein
MSDSQERSDVSQVKKCLVALLSGKSSSSASRYPASCVPAPIAFISTLQEALVLASEPLALLANCVSRLIPTNVLEGLLNDGQTAVHKIPNSVLCGLFSSLSAGLLCT